MSKPTVAILFGGCSEEHDVSVRSATEIAATIDTERYELVYVGISKAGVWNICDHPHPGWERDECRRAAISPDRETHGLLEVGRGEHRAIHIDVVFPVLHGRSGEDGAIQGLLELAGIPYVGCDIQSSAVCMDKSLTYIVARNAGIDTPSFVVVGPADTPRSSEFTFPVFVKPARSGSSFGVTRVDHPEDLGAAIATARRYDDKVLVERAVVGTEVGCAVLGCGTDLIAGEVDQITLSHGFFRIHQEAEPEKGSENATITVPADLSEGRRRRVQDTAKTIYSALGCRGLSRVDMFHQDDGHIVLNEVNTMPGFTAYSRYPRMMAAAGLPLSDVLDQCISIAMAR